MPLKSRPPRACRHCPAPVKSIFEGGPAKTTYAEKKYVIDTEEYRITRAFDEEMQIQKDTKKPIKMRKYRSMKSSNSTMSLGNTTMLTQTWSGSTFMTEYEDFMINLNYEKNKGRAERGREQWNKLKKKLRVIQFQRKTTNAGPDWFQDLSPYQMELTDNLHLILHGDIEEGHTARTQEYLFKVGIAPEVPPKVVVKSIQESGRDPIAFLFNIHKYLVELETEDYETAYQEAKKQKRRISPYSINERILLTCVFHLHFPKLLEKLDQILPEPEKEPRVMWAKKPPRKKCQYSSVYLEPLPINEKPWYEEQAEEELRKKVEAKMKKEKDKKEKEEFERRLSEQKRAAELEKEEKDMRAKASMMQRRRRESLYERFKDNRPLLEQSVFAINCPLDESVEKCFLPSRERKSTYFRTRAESSGQASSKPNLVTNEEEESSEETEVETDVGGLEYANDPKLWMVAIVSDGCTQTPIRGITKGCLYSPYVEDLDIPHEGVTEMFECNLRKAPYGLISDKGAQTHFTREFQPLKKAMRDFLLKQRAVEKQMEKFYLTALHKRGIFGPPTDNICKTNCLRDLEEMALNHEITVIKPPSVDIELEVSSEEEFDLFKAFQKHKIPRDISMKELLTVKRLEIQDTNSGKGNGIPIRRMSGPPLPVVPGLVKGKAKFKDDEYSEEIKCNEDECEPEPGEKENDQTDPFMNKPIPVECTDTQCELIEATELPIGEFALARKRIAVLPPKKQLETAIQFLCDKGDPLAVLPNIEQVPWLIRWFDRRRGEKRILTDKDKAELMQKSIDFWTADYNHCTMAPMAEMPEGLYSWSNKKWMMDKVDKGLYKHRRAVKHLLIDNARDLFPSTFCEYFHTPLNKSFRKLFYTYFPACERDCLVIKPWNPHESKEENKHDDES